MKILSRRPTATLVLLFGLLWVYGCRRLHQRNGMSIYMEEEHLRRTARSRRRIPSELRSQRI